MKFDFSLTHLRYFYDAAKMGAVGLAANKNFVTHSAISQGIKKLEQALTIPLVSHKKREFKLTDAGKSLVAECEKIFASVKNFEHQVQLTQKMPVGDLSFASSHSVVSAFLLGPLSELRKRHPQIQTSFKLGKTPYVKKWILDGTVDLGVTLDDGDLDGLEKLKLTSGKFVLIKRSGLKDEGLQFLLTELRPETITFRQQHLKKQKSEPSVLMNVDSWELITKMAEHGLGIGLVPDFQISKRNGRALEIVDMGINISYDLVAVGRKGEHFSRNAQILIDFLNKPAG